MSESKNRGAEKEAAGRAPGRRPHPRGRRLFKCARGGRRLIAAAAVLHVALAAGLFLAGRAQVAPRLLDRDGIMDSFAFDSYEYRDGAVRLAGVLKEEGPRAWAAEDEQAHVKLFSVLFALFAPLFGYSPLSAEPLNLFCYVAILCLVFTLGREVGGRRVGLVAAGAVALWPTFLLHTTQLLKDPLFIAGGLALVLIVTTWLTRTYSRAGAAVVAALTLAATALLLLVRVKFGAIVMAVVLFGFLLLVVRQLLEGRLLYWNMVCPLLILSAGALALFYATAGGQKQKQYPPAQVGQLKSVAGPGRSVPSVISYANPALPKTKGATYAGRLREAAEWPALEIISARYNYDVSYPESGSAIDRDVEFKNLGDMIRYLPRAFEIGLWAPFPDTWASAGKRVGSAGRLLSGAETFVIYLCQLLALFAVWRGPRRLASLLLLLLSTFGVAALGLIVSNVGTLYRFRYLFWMLLIILAAKGLGLVVAALRAGASTAPEREAELDEAARV
jgi:4-amino-4-deoxy-L-arabinose transferase-like glycosyltransferase